MARSVLQVSDRSAKLCPITADDVERVASFLHHELNARLTPASWARAIRPSWQIEAPNHGFMLLSQGRVVGAHVAFYSQRMVEGRSEKFCNLAAWCVLDAYRAHGLRLLKALLDQPGYSFTDLSPSGNVVPLNRRLKFQTLNTDATLSINLPWPRWASGVRIVDNPAVLRSYLAGRDLEIYKDHACAPAAHHLVIIKGGKSCYVIFRKDTRKRMRLFASILHVGNKSLFSETLWHLRSYLVTHFGLPATLIEERFVSTRPLLSLPLRAPRPKMMLSSRVTPSQVDYLYSELTCVPW